MSLVKNSLTGYQNIQLESYIADQLLCEEKKPREATGR